MTFRQFALFCLALGLRDGLDARPVDFQRDVRPILSENCFHCHGPDATERKAKLRLDTEDGSRKTARSDLAVIAPGMPEASELLRRVRAADPDERMPPAESKLELSAREIEILEAWVKEGAEYAPHWAFRAPERKLPEAPGAHPIDRLVRDELRASGDLDLRPEASRETLIRRLSFDLTGLPPSLDEIDAFLADERPDATERLVDRLLASPRYAERMTADWLDVARYADSYGFQVDRNRTVWPWRDWVLRSFRDNLPFDDFVTQQLAGDLLPDATDDTTLATMFNRLHGQKTEGGSVPEEFRVEYVADRVRTFSTAFLGLTFECSRCHDHKYDPITQKEFYELYAFFNQIDEAGLYAYFGNATPTPTLFVTDDRKKQEIARLRTAAEAKAKELADFRESRRAAFQEWFRKGPQTLLEATGATGGQSSTAKLANLVPEMKARHLFESFEGGKFPNSLEGARPASSSGANRLVEGRRPAPGQPSGGKAVELTGDDSVRLGLGNYRRFQPFSVALWLRPAEAKERTVVFHRSRAWTDSGSRGYQLLLEDQRPSASLIHFWPGNAIRVRTKAPLALGEWSHVAMTYDGSSRAAGLRLYVDGKLAEVEVVQDYLRKNITGTGGDEIAIGERFRDVGFRRGRVDDFTVVERELAALEVRELHDGKSLRKTLATAVGGRLTAPEREELFDYWFTAHDPECRKLRKELESARAKHAGAVDPLQELMVMKEQVTPRKTYILKRGHYAAPGEEVRPGTPSALPPMKPGLPRNRLGLARWLTDPEHPLFARVTVNRLWQMLLGRGLVGTPEDFGSQGELPRHAALLDWLALEFVRLDWDLKALIRTIVSSEVYRQESSGDSRLFRDDPQNRLLARGARHRLPGEMIRDNALAVAGLLVERHGGAPAKPYDLTESFKPMGRDKGPALYRRSVYTFWKRTAPSPTMMTLDAAKREVCVVKREETSSPLQAIVLLNDPQMVEAARAFAWSLIKIEDEGELITRAFRVLTSRRPQEGEVSILRQLLEAELAAFRAAPERAKQYLEVGDWRPPAEVKDPARLAALTVLVSTLQNFDECVVKR